MMYSYSGRCLQKEKRNGVKIKTRFYLKHKIWVKTFIFDILINSIYITAEIFNWLHHIIQNIFKMLNRFFSFRDFNNKKITCFNWVTSLFQESWYLVCVNGICWPPLYDFLWLCLGEYRIYDCLKVKESF